MSLQSFLQTIEVKSQSLVNMSRELCIGMDLILGVIDVALSKASDPIIQAGGRAGSSPVAPSISGPSMALSGGVLTRQVLAA
jgi:hypothetical protein